MTDRKEIFTRVLARLALEHLLQAEYETADSGNPLIEEAKLTIGQAIMYIEKALEESDDESKNPQGRLTLDG